MSLPETSTSPPPNLPDLPDLDAPDLDAHAAEPRKGAPAAGGPPAAKPALALVLFPVIAICAVLAFVWPAARSAPHGLPIAVAGSAPATAALRYRLESTGDTFEVRTVADENTARRLIRDREVYGALVVTPGGTAALTAPAASPAVAGLLEQAFGAHGAGGRTEAVAPLPAHDPRGAALPAMVVPLVLAGIVGGILTFLMTRRLSHRLLVAAGGSAAGGLGIALLMQGWLKVLEGTFALNAGALALVMLSISATLAGLASVIGPRGIGMVAVLVAVFGNAFSGVTSAPDLLPEPAATLGALLPPGAGAGLLRSTAYFDGAGAAGHLAVLLGWSTLGLLLLVVSAMVPGRRGPSGRGSAA